LIPHLLIFSGLKPLPLNFLSPVKVTVPRDPFVKTFDSGTGGFIVFNFCEILRAIPLFTAMEAALCRLAPLDQQQGAPWPHQMRQFL
jgi:hypothetical protein